MEAVKTHEELLAIMSSFWKTEHNCWLIPIQIPSPIWKTNWVFTCEMFSAGYTASENSLYFRRMTTNKEVVINFFSGLK